MHEAEIVHDILVKEAGGTRCVARGGMSTQRTRNWLQIDQSVSECSPNYGQQACNASFGCQEPAMRRI